MVEGLDLSELQQAYAGHGSAPLAVDRRLCHRLLFQPQDRAGARLEAEVQERLTLAEASDGANRPDGMRLPQELARREERLAAGRPTPGASTLSNRSSASSNL